MTTVEYAVGTLGQVGVAHATVSEFPEQPEGANLRTLTRATGMVATVPVVRWRRRERLFDEVAGSLMRVEERQHFVAQIRAGATTRVDEARARGLGVLERLRDDRFRLGPQRIRHVLPRCGGTTTRAPPPTHA